MWCKPLSNQDYQPLSNSISHDWIKRLDKPGYICHQLHSIKIKPLFYVNCCESIPAQGIWLGMFFSVDPTPGLDARHFLKWENNE